MQLKKIESGKEKLTLEVIGEGHTLLNLLRNNAWKMQATHSSYTIEHPYLASPKITIRSKNPKKTLLGAVQQVLDDTAEFQKALKRAL